MSLFDQEIWERALAKFDADRTALLEEYFTFLRFESVSSEASFKDQVTACATWVRQLLDGAGFRTELWESSGHPVVFAEYRSKNPNAPTVLIYNHYDVQPVDPLELWASSPFEPRVDGDTIYARGAQDNKGQCFYVLAAVRWMLQEYGELPLNVKLIVEGEEEIGSPSLPILLQQYESKVKADSLLVVDMGSHDPKIPAVTLGCRGMVCMTLTFTGSKIDLHSGMVGGVVFNPNHALVEILGKLHDSQGRVTVPGFYDRVSELSEADRKHLSLHFSEPEFEAMFSTKATGGEAGFSPLERAWLRPTLEINGISGGYSGEGFKTVIPAQAQAKLSCRLVPDQDPEEIGELVKKHLLSLAPKGVDVAVEIHPGSGAPVRSGPNGRTVAAVKQALDRIFATPCSFILSGGSIPIVECLAKASGAEVVMMGFGLADDAIHAPNERFSISRLRSGFATMAESLRLLGKKS